MSRQLVLRLVPPSYEEMKRDISIEVSKVFAQILSREAPGIKKSIGDLIRKAIYASPEYESFQGGALQAELGVVDPNYTIEQIIANIANGVEIVANPVKTTSEGFGGGLEIRVLKGDMSEALSAPGGSFYTEKGAQIPWVYWLLFGGDRILVASWDFLGGTTFPRSRTGLGIMIPSSTSWRVPPEYSGTVDDNWLTRAIVPLGAPGGEMEKIIVETIQKGLERAFTHTT